MVVFSSHATKPLRWIWHAWHFYNALVLVIRLYAEALALRASQLNWEVCAYEENLYGSGRGQP